MIRRSMTRRLATLAALAVAGALLGGCGEPASITDRDATLRLTLDEYRFEPQNLTVQATDRPMRIHIVAHNVGVLTHNVVIESIEPNADQGTATQPTIFMQTDTAHPGATVSKNAYLQPGTYRITCSIGNHDNLGMYGKLVVVAPRT
jgi:plastocyanin